LQFCIESKYKSVRGVSPHVMCRKTVLAQSHMHFKEAMKAGIAKLN